ncbi:hypothetical protein Hanom_Chr06g00527571 [Helianthus anomalus]
MKRRPCSSYVGRSKHEFSVSIISVLVSNNDCLCHRNILIYTLEYIRIYYIHKS